MDASMGARVARGLWRSVGAAIIAAGIVAVVSLRGSSAVETPRVLPRPAVDEQPGPSTSETAVFAGGCFWGVQGVFQHIRGVSNAVSGYAGGAPSSAHYEMVGSGRTGHAESVAVTFDPRQITYGRLLQVFFSVAHDPTQLNRQGPDVGSQYRSAVFPTSDEQARIAKAYIAQLTDARVFAAAIVTTIEPSPRVPRRRGLSSGLPDSTPRRTATSSSTICRRFGISNGPSPSSIAPRRNSSRGHTSHALADAGSIVEDVVFGRLARVTTDGGVGMRPDIVPGAALPD